MSHTIALVSKEIVCKHLDELLGMTAQELLYSHLWLFFFYQRAILDFVGNYGVSPTAGIISWPHGLVCVLT